MHVQSNRKEEAHGEWNAEHIVYTSPDQIPLDDREDASRKMERCDDIEEITAHEDDVGRLDGNRRSRSKSDTDGGRYEGRRIVDTIADLEGTG